MNKYIESYVIHILFIPIVFTPQNIQVYQIIIICNNKTLNMYINKYIYSS